MSNDENTLVAGSSPAIRTIIPQQIEGAGAADTARTQESAEFDSRKVRFPKRIKHRGWVLRRDYLPAAHRLNEADAMRPERANEGKPSKSGKNVIPLPAASRREAH
jgi:hypothetical protein